MLLSTILFILLPKPIHQHYGSATKLIDCPLDTNVDLYDPQTEVVGIYTDLSWASSNYGVVQKIAGDGVKSTAKAVREMISYMNTFGETTNNPDLLLSPCQNKEELCCFWASAGECTRGDTEYMLKNCGPCCQSCKPEDFKANSISTELIGSAIDEYFEDGIIIGRAEEREFSEDTDKALSEVQIDLSLDYSLLPIESKKYGVLQLIEEENTATAVQEMIHYMNNLVVSSEYVDPEHGNYILSKCQNKKSLCCFWASIGECDDPETGGYMDEFCGPCCLSCLATDNHQGLEAQKVDEEEFEALALQMSEASQKFGKAQGIEDGETGTLRAVQQMIDYMNDIILVVNASDPDYASLTNCQNENELCCFWASIGECDNPETKGYMEEYCGPCCMHCAMAYQNFETQEVTEGGFEALALQMSETSKKFGKAQEIVDGEKDTLRAVQEMINYMTDMTSIMSASDPNYTSLTKCQNRNELCCFWASIGECEKPGSKIYMEQFCGPCCNSCSKTQKDNEEDFEALALKVSEMSQKFGKAQEIVDGEKGTLRAVQKMINYMTDMTLIMSASDPNYTSLTKCQNRNELCCFWASIGECEKPGSKGYMDEFCKPCCLSCL